MHILDLKAVTKAAVAVTAAAALVSCGGGGSDGGPGPGAGTPPPPPAVPFPGQLGIGFSITFGAAANAEPRDPQAGDVIPVSLSAEPIDVPDPM
jgi:hypothetical protein